MATYRIAVLPGDGIGQEVTPEAVRVLEAVGKGTGAVFEFERGLVGGAAIDATGKPLAPGTLELCRGAHAILFGAVGGPKWDDVPHEQRPERGLLAIRKELDLYANLRPAKCFPMLVDASPLKRQGVEGTDLMVIRELTRRVHFCRAPAPAGLPGRRARDQHDGVHLARGGAHSPDRLRGRPQAAPAADVGRQGERAGGVAALARGGDARRPRLPGRDARPRPGRQLRNGPGAPAHAV